MKAKGINIRKLGSYISLVLLCLFSFWKIRLGIHSDEVHSIAVGDMIAQGNAFFKECWFYLQLSAVFTAPVISIYEKVVGSRDGILLFFRVISVCIQLGVCVYFYSVFKEKYQKRYVLIACVLLFTFIPDFQSFTYKQELIWLATLEILFSYKYYLTYRKRYLIFLGIVIACSVLAYPTAILQFPVYLLLVYMIDRMKLRTENGLGDIVTITITCFLCAVVFLAIVFRQISINQFIEFFPRVFMDQNLDKSFVRKLLHPLVKFGAMGIMAIAPVVFCEKIKKIQLPVVTFLLWGAFLGQVFIERSGVTWHCVTYPYTLTLFFLPLLCWINDRNKAGNRVLFCFFEIPAITIVLCMALASNQGNITSMYGTLFSAVGLVLALGDRDNKAGVICGEKSIIAASMCIYALSMYLIPVTEQETVMPDHTARTIFTERTLVSEGPAAGIYLGNITYEKYLSICGIIRENVSSSDKLFLVDDHYTASYGYLASRGGYATYSPQGGWGLAESDQAVHYFADNPEKEPTVVIIRKEYIKCELGDYFQETAVGNYLREKGFYTVEESGDYIVMRKNTG